MRRLLAALAALFAAPPALAQTQPAMLPPETAVISPGGVDMVSGRYVNESTDLSIGSDANGGITFTRHEEKTRPFRSNWHVFLNRDCRRTPGSSPQDPCTVVWEIESKAIAKSWLESPPGFFQLQGLPLEGVSKLERHTGFGTYFTFTAVDGSVYRFETTSTGGDAWVTSLTRKDGIVYSFTYDNGGDPADGSNRPRRVKSNSGYELILEYTGSGSDRISKACVFNTAVVAPPVANSCPVGNPNVRTVTYAYAATNPIWRLAAVTDPLGKVWTIDNQSGTTSFYKPGIASPWLVNTLDPEPGGFFLRLPVGQQAFADGRTITYSYADYTNLADPPIPMLETGRGAGWTENGTATTALLWESNQANDQAPQFISPAPVQITDPLGRTTLIDFDQGVAQPFGHVLSKILPNGRKESFQYGTAGVLEQRKWEKATGFTDPDLITSFTYNCTVEFNCGKPETMTDPRGAVTNYTYSPGHGLILTETLPDPDGAGPLPRPQKRYSYAQFQARYKNSSGAFVNGTPVWLLTQIAECRTLAAPCAASDETLTIFTYPAAGTTNNLLPLSRTVKGADNVLIATTTWTYDGDGNKLTEDGPLLSPVVDISRWRYDAKRRVTATMGPDPDGAGVLKPVATVSTYDDAGRLTKTENGTVNSQATDWSTFVATDSEEFTYDALDRKTAARKKSGGTTYAVTQYTYDLFGRLECTAVRMNETAFGSLPASACDQTPGVPVPDRITKNSYDLAGQLIKVTEALLTADEADEATYAYTLAGKRQFLTDARNFRAQFVYDGHDRQTEWRFPDKVLTNTVSATDKEVYQLDLNGNRTRLTKRDGQVINYSYDLLNRMTVKDVPGTAGDVAYAYNNLGAQTAATFSATGQGVTSQYDALGRLTSSTTNMGGTSRQLSYQYDLAGRRTRVTHPDGIFFTYEYDPAARLTAIRQSASTALATFAYDTPGRLQTLTRPNGTSTTYAYDPISRLGSLTQNLASTPSDATFSFTYNEASQILTRALSNDAYAFTAFTANSKAYSVNGLNQYTAVAGTTHAYDANGNLTSDGATTYAYDVENRLTGATGARTATLVYDPLGRIYQTSGTGGPGTRRLLYDGDELVAEYDGSNALVKRYVHGAAVDDPVVEYTGSTLATRSFLHSDHQGSIVAISDASGNGTLNKYDEYGVPQPTFTGRFGYTGQIWIPELGLWHYKARAYSPSLGRFMQVDPTGYQDLANLYAYVGNDPLNTIDPEGEACLFLFNHQSTFCTRALLYDRMNQMYGHKTSFFAAAAVVNRAMANLDLPASKRFGNSITPQARSLLVDLGRGLMQMNISAARNLGTNRAQNDRNMVRAEQNFVQNRLDALKARDPKGFSVTISTINDVFNSKNAVGLAAQEALDPAFNRAMTRTLTQVGTFDFSNREHRITLGDNIVREINLEKPDCTGTRLCPN